jgi:putative endonuclease
MPNARQRYGQMAETIAVDHLKARGYKILAQNYRTRLGEIDVIAGDGDTIVFVEVKARRSNRYGNPKAAVTREKQRKISMVALQYLKQNDLTHCSARFDVVAIGGPQTGSEIEIVKNAFELAYT